jgi:hypothetical protein
MSLKSPGTIAILLKKAKKVYQKQAVNPKCDEEQMHGKADLGLKRLKVFASKDPALDSVQTEFQAAKKGLLRQLKAYHTKLRQNEKADANKATLPKYLKTLGSLTLAVRKLQLDELEDTDDENASLDSVPDMTADEEKLLAGDHFEEEASGNGAAKPAQPSAAPQPAQDDPEKRQQAVAAKFRSTEKTLATMGAALDNATLRSLYVMLEDAESAAVAAPDRGEAVLNEVLAKAREVLKARAANPAEPAPAGDEEEVEDPLQVFRKEMQLELDYHGRRGLVVELLDSDGLGAAPEELERWRKVLELGDQQAGKGDWDQALAAVQRLLGIISAKQATAPPETREQRKAARAKRATRRKALKDLNAKVAEKTGLTIRELREDDNAALKQTQDPNRAVNKLNGFDAADARQFMDGLKGNLDLTQAIGTGFADLEQDLKGAWTDRGKSKALAAAKGRASDLVTKGTSKDAILMLTRTPEQRKDDVVASMGLISDKYQGVTRYKDLSKEKRHLVDSIAAGLEEGLGSVRAGAVRSVAVEAEKAMKQAVKTLPAASDRLFDLTMKSAADLTADAAIGLGLVLSEVVADFKARAAYQAGTSGLSADQVAEVQLGWMENLPQDAQDLVKAAGRGMVEAIDANAPNSFNPTANTVTLNGQKYDSPQELGQGGVGKIYKFKKQKAKDDDPDEFVVVKSLHNANRRLDMERELIVHRLAMGGENGKGHDNIVPMKGLVRGPDGSLHMILEEAKGGDLSRTTAALGHAVSGGVMPDAAAKVLAREFVRDAVAGLKFFQDQNLAHLDVKEQNFLMAEDGRVMLADFGSGLLGRDGQGTVPSLGDNTVNTPVTGDRMAPEYFNKKSKTATSRVDTFSLGVMIHEMMGGNVAKRPADGAGATALEKLTSSMMSRDPAKRPTLEAVEQCSLLQRDAEFTDDQIATLKAAAMEYSKVTAKALGTRITAKWLATQTLPWEFGASADVSTFQVEMDKLRAQVDEGEQAKAKLEAGRRALGDKFQADSKQLGERIAALSKNHADALKKAGAEQALKEAKQKYETADAAAVQKIADAQARIDTKTRNLEAFQVAVDRMLKADPTVQKAEQQLQAAAAPFATGAEEGAIDMAALHKRLDEVNARMADLQNLAPGANCHATLLKKFNEFAALKGNPRQFRLQLRELEDQMAFVAGDKGLQDLMARHARMKDNTQHADAGMARMAELSVEDLTTQIEAHLDRLVK